MKAGILESDRVVTVSPHYAQEILSGPAKGVELDSACRVATLTGITNGTDIQDWNPVTDEYIGVNYDSTTVSSSPNFQLIFLLITKYFLYFKSPICYLA